MTSDSAMAESLVFGAPGKENKKTTNPDRLSRRSRQGADRGRSPAFVEVAEMQTAFGQDHRRDDQDRQADDQTHGNLSAALAEGGAVPLNGLLPKYCTNIGWSSGGGIGVGAKRWAQKKAVPGKDGFEWG